VSSDAVAFREVPADSIKSTLRAILTDENSYRGYRPRNSGPVPDPEYVIKWWDYELVISSTSDVIHVWSRSIMLEVPLGRRRGELQRLLKAIFPS
jgi:hypothetical protein